SDLGSTTVTTYRQDFPFNGMVDTSLISRSSDGAALIGHRMTYQSSNPYPGVYEPVTSGTATDLYTYGHLDATQQTTTAYDNYGNPLLISNLGDGTGAPYYTAHTYLNDENAWLIGLCTSTTRLADAAGTRVLG